MECVALEDARTTSMFSIVLANILQVICPLSTRDTAEDSKFNQKIQKRPFFIF